jgi:hypothetical protein
LKLMEQDLLGNNTKKIVVSPKKKKSRDVLNLSIEQAKSIEESLRVLEKIKDTPDEDSVDISGAKLNKLWHRLTGVNEKLYQPLEIYHLKKHDVAQFYEEAKEVVLQSDLKMLLETSGLAQLQNEKAVGQQRFEAAKRDDDSDVSTMNSIANIETEEEFPGSQAMESKTVTATSTGNNDELHHLLANQMKSFVDTEIKSGETELILSVKDVSIKFGTPMAENVTFKVRSMTPDELDVSVVSFTDDMDIEKDSLIHTEPLVSIDSSSVDAEGFIIPELNIQVTDMDQDGSNDQLIEDISFPNLEISMSDETSQHDDNNRNDLSTITECTEYEASQGSSDDEISSEIVSCSSAVTTSERVGSEVKKRLISINDSLEEVNEAFKKIVIINQSSSTVTYSTDKDFAESPTSDSNEKPHSQMPSANESDSTSTVSHITTSTPKVLPDIISEASGGNTDSNDF